MENTECFEIINRLSVRIAKDESDQLKGSGILFLRQVGEMAVVFTAAHVIIDIFKEGESQICLSLGCMDSFGNPQKINVEAKLAMNISDFVPEEGSICIHPDYMQTDPSSIADIAMILIPWQEWMNTMGYMKISQGILAEELYGYGFPLSMDKEREKKGANFLDGKRELQGRINGISQNKTYSIEYKFSAIGRMGSRSSVMEGYSGTGLFSFRNNSINLICIISEECGDNSSGTLLRATSSEKCRELLELTNLHSEYPRSFERYKELAGFTFPSSRSKAKRLFYDFSEELMEDCDLLPENCVEKWYDELSCKSDRKKCDKFWTGKLELMAILYGSGFVSGANVTKPVINMPDPYENDQVEVEYICTEDETESVLGRLIEAEYFAKRGKLKNGTLFVLNSNNGRFFLYPRHECRAIVRDITACEECSNRALKNKLGQFLPENSKESENFDIIDGAAIHCNLAAISVDRMLDLMSRNKIDKCLLQENMAGVLKELWEL